MAKHRPVPRVDALQLSAAPVGDVLLTTSRVGPSNSQTPMFPRKRPSRKARKSLAEARNVMIERGRNDSGLDPAHADASDSESLAEVCIEKTTRSRNDSDLDLAHAGGPTWSYAVAEDVWLTLNAGSA